MVPAPKHGAIFVCIIVFRLPYFVSTLFWVVLSPQLAVFATWSSMSVKLNRSWSLNEFRIPQASQVIRDMEPDMWNDREMSVLICVLQISILAARIISSRGVGSRIKVLLEQGIVEMV
ncbi:hypothetical protein F4810DRAFT_177668 [Camillea tinctor]|nr:hypothetical protein F4810DRAFT_177668 [Camillea tinctor]